MGTALATPLAHNHHQVHLWGTWLDDEIVVTLQAGGAHPRMRIPVAEGIRIFGHEEIGPAIAGADIVLFAVSSNGIQPVAERAAPHLAAVPMVMTVAKGFADGPDGRVVMLPEVIACFTEAPIVGVGGPSKANEVARGIPTAVVYGGDSATARLCQGVFANDVYKVELTDDLAGVEMSAAMKNGYAIALGVADGLEKSTDVPHHNFQASLFPLAVDEIGILCELAGGRAETAHGRAGSGDLQVTITSGRNRMLGERIGRGEPGPDAARALREAGVTVEGYATLDYGYRFAQQAGADMRRLPLLDALRQVLYDGAPALETLWAVV
jgi:glycerol-3-phosphate dehydrogenase (NAD(P)+)